MRILIVESTRSLWQMLQLMLPGHQCQWAPDGTTALAATAAGVDLALVACCLDHTPTTGLVRRLQEHCRVVVLSSDDQCSQKARMRGVPVLDKPFSWGALQVAVKAAAPEPDAMSNGTWGWG